MKKTLLLLCALLMGCGDKGSYYASQGDPGVQGPKGADGTTITLVQLCPGVSNYGTFIEVAMCIDDNLYGVYSANNGFLTYLPPGNYTSNAIGSACNLTIQPHCVVSH